MRRKKRHAESRPRALPYASPRPALRVRKRRLPFTTSRKVALAASAVLIRATMGVRRRRTAAGIGRGRWQRSRKWALAAGKNEGNGLMLKRSGEAALEPGGAGLGLGVGLRRCGWCSLSLALPLRKSPCSSKLRWRTSLTSDLWGRTSGGT